MLFLDADEETLIDRYKETRRRHPLAPESSVAAGIAAERAMLAPLRERADLVIDSTGLKAHDLRRKIADELLPRSAAAALALTFECFGFKHGPPRDADLVFDVRFLPNPHYVPEPAPADRADDRASSSTSSATGKLAEFYEHLEPLLDFLAARTTWPRARRT